MKDKSVKILLSYFKPSYLFKNDMLVPIHAGRDVAKTQSRDGVLSAEQLDWMEKNTIGDNTGENISALNRNFCEMTTQYWAWKNYDKIGNPDYIGFMQYRRHYVLNPAFDKLQRDNHDICYSMFAINKPFDGYLKTIGLTKKNILNLLKDYDIILPKLSDFSLIDLKSIREDYTARIEGTKLKDYENFIEYIKGVDPDFGAFMEKISFEPKKYLYLSMVTSKKVFMDYANFIFPLLMGFNKTLDISDYSINGKRTIAYLGELLYSNYFQYMKAKGKLKVKEVDVTMLQTCNLEDKKAKNLKAKYFKYWIMSKITFANKRKKYKQKRKALKSEIQLENKLKKLRG